MFSKKIKTITLGLMATAILFATSCKKEEPTPVPAKATITVTSPSETDAFDHNATVNITGKIEYSEGLHGYKIFIRKKADNSVQFEKNEHAHGTTIDFSESWVNNLDGHNDMELEVIAILDHDGNTTSKKVNFHCHH
jgi:phosphate-selective porin